MNRAWILAIVASSTSVACTSSSSSNDAPIKPSPCTSSAGAFAPYSTRCGQIVDADGRVVIFRGVNARVAGAFDVDLGPGKVPLEGIPVLSDADFARMRAIGFTVLRLPIQWSGVEPNDASPPAYSTAYLDGVAAIVASAGKADVKVLLDLHQDAYSKYIGEDGAPLWAIVPAPAQTLEGPLDDLGTRRTSVEVQEAFTTFFAQSNADGARLRARFGAMAAFVAGYFKGNAAVLGLELFNEPLAVDDDLRAFDEEVGAAIRAADPNRLLFFEPPATRNLLDVASLASTPLSLGGVVYAPHVYTHAFVSDPTWNASFTYDDIRPSNANARDEADSWSAPLFVGEYGWDPNGTRFSDYVTMQLRAQDEFMAGSTFWLWKEDSPQGAWGLFDHDASATQAEGWTERAAARKAFARVEPIAIGGWPESWSWDEAASRFELDFVGDESVHGATVVHLPLADDVAGPWKASCDGASLDATADAHGDLSIACGGLGADGEHRIVVERAE